jgi:ABC-type transporter Mla subunit MlaD
MPQSLPSDPPAPEANEAPPAVNAPAGADSTALQPLIQRTCQALHAMARSLEALESVFERMEALEAHEAEHHDLLSGTQETVARVIALLRREGPPLLHRAQALRLRLRLQGYAAGSSTAQALRTLHADLDGLAAFAPEERGSVALLWAPYVRRARSNTLIMLSEFDRHARQIAAQSQPARAVADAPLGRPEGSTILPFEAPKPG